MKPAERVELLRAALSEHPGGTPEDLHWVLLASGRYIRLETVKSTLHAFKEYFVMDGPSGCWHLRFSRLAVAQPA